MTELSIVIPVYNNENSLQTLVADIQKVLDTKILYELILVNDGSIDNSWKIINSIVSQPSIFNTVKAIKLEKNYGQENAIMAGLAIAKGNYILIMDADYQHNPIYILDLLAKCKEGYDVCYANFNNSTSSLFKKMGSWFYNTMATKFYGKPKHIYISSYNIMTKNIAEKIVAFSSSLVNIEAIIFQHTKNVTQIFVEQNKSMKEKYKMYLLFIFLF